MDLCEVHKVSYLRVDASTMTEVVCTPQKPSLHSFHSLRYIGWVLITRSFSRFIDHTKYASGLHLMIVACRVPMGQINHLVVHCSNSLLQVYRLSFVLTVVMGLAALR